MIEYCNEIDCLLHPNYKKSKPDSELKSNDEFQSHYHDISHSHDIVSQTSGVAIPAITSGTSGSSVFLDPSCITNDQLSTCAFDVNDKSSGKLVFKIDNELEIALECLLCNHCMKIDMKKYVLTKRAKELLEGK